MVRLYQYEVKIQNAPKEKIQAILEKEEEEVEEKD